MDRSPFIAGCSIISTHKGAKRFSKSDIAKQVVATFPRCHCYMVWWRCKSTWLKCPPLSKRAVKKRPRWKVSEKDQWTRGRSEVKCLFDPPVQSVASAMATDAEMCPTLASQARIPTLKFHSFWRHPLVRPYFLFIQMMSGPAIYWKPSHLHSYINISCRSFQNYSQTERNIFSLWGNCRLVTSASSENHRGKLALSPAVSCQIHL